jgi:hypothetical protein
MESFNSNILRTKLSPAGPGTDPITNSAKSTARYAGDRLRFRNMRALLRSPSTGQRDGRIPKNNQSLMVIPLDINVELAEKFAATAANQLMVAQLLFASKTASARETNQANQNSWTVAGH